MSDPSFPEALRQAMAERELSANELARRIWGDTIDARGQPIGRNASEISKYLRGRQHPSVVTIKRLADAIGVPVERLINAGREAPFGNKPVYRLKSDDLRLVAVDEPGLVRLQVNRVLDQATAMKIFGILSA
jgi:transcriptional regulator with XRE-family HTH domain